MMTNQYALEDDPTRAPVEDQSASADAALTTYQSRLLAAPVAAQSLYDTAAADLRAAFDAGSEPVQAAISTSWQHYDALYKHTTALHGDAAALAHAAGQLRDQRDKLALEYGDFVAQVKNANLTRREVADLWNRAYDSGAEDASEEMMDMSLSDMGGCDLFVQDAGFSLQPMLAFHDIDISHAACRAFGLLLFASEWLNEVEHSTAQELANFIEGWTRRALIETIVDPDDENAAEMSDTKWWETYGDLVEDVEF